MKILTDSTRESAESIRQLTDSQRRFREILKNWQLYLLLLIPLIYIIVFAYYPMTGLQLAFKKFNPNFGIWGSEWVGFKHFNRFFESYQFKRVLTNTLRLSIYSLIAGFPLPILLALCINAAKNDRLKKITQNVTYIPHFISMAVLVGMLFQVFNPITGIYGVLGKAITGARVADILGLGSTFPHMYVWSDVWQNMGFNSIIYLAALSSADPELHESAQIDGATRVQRIRFIDFPTILPTITIMLILRMGWVMNIGFEKTFLMQNSLNLAQSEVISTYVYKVGLHSATNDYSFATAIGFFNSVLNFFFIVTMNSISKRFSDTSLW